MTPHKERRPAIDAAIVLAVGSGFAYLLSFQYLAGYYARLGIEENQLSFDAGFVHSRIILVLAFPAVWLVFVAIFGSLATSRRNLRETIKQPFHPVPPLRVVSIVLTLWALKLFLEVIKGPNRSTFGLWAESDVVLVALGTGLVAIQYLRSYHVAHRMLGKWVTAKTRARFLMFVVLTALTAITGRNGGVNWWMVALLGIGWLIVAWDIATDLYASPGRSLESPPERATKPTPSETILLTIWIAALLVLSAGFAGNVAAGRLAKGCEARKIVSFEPMPSPLLSNHTYWMVLHRDDTYFVRDITVNSTTSDYVVIQQPGMTAILGMVPPHPCNK